MRRLRQANLRHGGDDHARLEAFSDRLVLGPYLIATHSNGIAALQLQLSTTDLDHVERFGILVCSDEAGAAILEAAPPQR